MDRKVRKRVWYIAGLILCIVPPVLSALEHFPIWISEGMESTVSAISLIVLTLCMIPTWKIIREYLKSPSAWSVWLIILIFSYLIGNVADEMMSIAAVALPANLCGAVCFRMAKSGKSKDVAGKTDDE